MRETLGHSITALAGMEPPVTPDGAEARRWAEEELSKAQYAQARPSWLDQLWRDFLDWLNSLEGDGTSPESNFAVPVIIALAVVLIVVAIFVVRPRLNAKRKTSVSGMYGRDAAVDAATYRKRALAAADDGDWPTAVVDQFRALVRSAEERDVIEARAGRTADEAAGHLGLAFTPAQHRLVDAARLFDAVRYGEQAATRSDYDELRKLDMDLLALTPDFSDQEQQGFAVPR
ncbi:DUF4129 domain-containing protein [Paenarthrobacter aromaticivorans]|uniref:DUF4129 domain-containing protein n=1 Tax=Paenarthrobacter aromaticivorans TaxID=2849150 RepID=A0ABS6I394_9MICC|nr:DUF4129 domain-containing protein [Paenarthrobacter sp. MMS21-TAE1-1]MBU8866216.1 DUF4129 domain-containing protein [Paenarthrobacter sp. MMS21-TAE1-1]